MKIKKSTFRVLGVLSLSMLLFSGCAKDDIAPAETGSNQVAGLPGTAKLDDPDAWGAHMVFIKNGDRWVCFPKGKSCYDAFVVRAVKVMDFEGAIAHGKQGIQKFFSDSERWPLLFPGLNATENRVTLKKLQSGTFDIQIHDAGNDLKMYIARGGNPYEEFAFQIYVK